MKKVIWLASWFPTEERLVTGDFIERHAKSASLYRPVHIIHVARIHDKNSRSGIFTKEYKDYPALKTEIYTYRLFHFFGIDLLISYCYSLLLYIRRVKAFINDNGRPDLIHVHVTLRCGLAALYFKWIYKIPFIVTEHNGALLLNAQKYGAKTGPLDFQFMKIILKRASAITAVSNVLKKAISERFKVKEIVVIPNVVDTSIFYPAQSKKTNESKVFLHVSTLIPGKNVDLILKAFAIVKNEYSLGFICKIIGPYSKDLVQLSEHLGISENVEWLPETDQYGVAFQMQNSDAAILYSSYESFGCINIEANATGIPVVVSDIETFHEYLHQDVNALFVPPHHEHKLAEIIATFIKEENNFDSSKIVASSQRFSFPDVGKKFDFLYRKLEEDKGNPG